MRVVFVTGERGAGKSTLLRHLTGPGSIQSNITNLPRFFGVVTRTVRSRSGQERTIYAEILPAGISGVLASTDSVQIVPPGGPQLGPFHFSQPVCDHVNRVLAEGAGYAAVIDEVGPLELNIGSGFLQGLLAVLRSRHPVIIVVRPDLVPQLTRLVAGYRSAGSIAVFQIESPEQAESLAHHIRADLGAGPDGSY